MRGAVHGRGAAGGGRRDRPAAQFACSRSGRGRAPRLRAALSDLLDAKGPSARDRGHALVAVAHAAADCDLHLPARIGDYTDFFAGIHHATNAGRLFRPDNPLLPNYKHMPVAYHGRASSIRASGHAGAAAERPAQAAGSAGPDFGPCRNLDYELELGVWIGPGNALGTAIPIGDGRRSTSPASACSTTGRRATSRPGSTSRSVRSSARISPARFRRG